MTVEVALLLAVAAVYGALFHRGLRRARDQQQLEQWLTAWHRLGTAVQVLADTAQEMAETLAAFGLACSEAVAHLHQAEWHIQPVQMVWDEGEDPINWADAYVYVAGEDHP